MKKHFFWLFCFTASLLLAQKNKNRTDLIAESEMKSAEKLMNFVVNQNTSNYDVTYHKLEFTVNPNVKFITGKVFTTFKALSDMSTITFDFANSLTVSSVKMGSTNLAFVENTNNELIITLPSTQVAGTTAIVEINYSGTPPSNGMGSFEQTTHNGTPIIWTLSEPFGVPLYPILIILLSLTAIHPTFNRFDVLH
jgi:aminopeptidase N